MDTPTSPLDDALALLGSLTPIQRARVLSALLDGHNTKLLTSMRTKAVYDATRADGATYASVAEQLGVTPRTVNKAVTQHRKATAAHASPMDTSR